MPIRPARRDDCDRLPAIERAAAERFRAVGRMEVAEADVSDPVFIRACLRHGVVLVATDDGDTPVGFALAGALDRCLHLYELDVHPDHGRRGHGTALLEGIAAAARARGLAGVTLSTFADVPWNAPFYAARGFRPLDAVDWTPGLHLIRNAEAALGLDLGCRVLMRRPVA
jgi:GNAT superfamily N-acetyltransferase